MQDLSPIFKVLPAEKEVVLPPTFGDAQGGTSISSDGAKAVQPPTISNKDVSISVGADIQSALNQMEGIGGGTVFLNNGTYTLAADINIPAGVALRGASRDGVLIDCNSSYTINIKGTDAYATGTVAINNGDTTVVGTGTTWTAAMVGQSILLDNIWYEITARTDNTHLTISPAYSNDNLSGAAYAIATVNTAASIGRVNVFGATGAGIKIQYAMEPTIDDILVYDCGTGLDLDQVVYPRIYASAFDNGVNLDMYQVGGFDINFCFFGTSTTGAGVVMNSSGDATFFNSSITGNTGNGLTITACSRIAFISVTVNQNGAAGIESVSGSFDCQFTDMIVDSNAADGIKLAASTDRIKIKGLTISNNGAYGVNIAAATCDDSIVALNTFFSNATANMNDAGTTTLIRSNIGVADN